MIIYESSKQKCIDTFSLMKELDYKIFRIPFFYTNNFNNGKMIEDVTNDINPFSSNGINFLLIPKEIVFNLQTLNNSLDKFKKAIFYQS